MEGVAGAMRVECIRLPRSSHVTRHTSHVTRHTSHVTRNESPANADVEQPALLEPQNFFYLTNVTQARVTCHMSHVSHVTRVTHVTCHTTQPTLIL